MIGLGRRNVGLFCVVCKNAYKESIPEKKHLFEQPHMSSPELLNQDIDYPFPFRYFKQKHILSYIFMITSKLVVHNAAYDHPEGSRDCRTSSFTVVTTNKQTLAVTRVEERSRK
jgi:hypothetical protein